MQNMAHMEDEKPFNRKRRRTDFFFKKEAQRSFNHLPYKKARDLLKTKHSCLCEVELQKRINLPPKYIGNVNDGINQTLQSLLFTFDQAHGGLLVAYDKVVLKQKTGAIRDENPAIIFDVLVNFIVFRPKVGDTLRGTVSRVGKHHYACLVHDCFNASVKKPLINLTYGKRKAQDDVVEVGSTICFEVTSIDIEDTILSIKGILTSFSSRHSLSLVNGF